MRNVVVLPAPLGPSSPKISPRRTSNDVRATAVKSPNMRTRSRTTIAGWSSGADAGRGWVTAAGGGAVGACSLALAQHHHERVLEFFGTWLRPRSSEQLLQALGRRIRLADEANGAALRDRVEHDVGGIEQARLELPCRLAGRRRGDEGQAVRARAQRGRCAFAEYLTLVHHEDLRAPFGFVHVGRADEHAQMLVVHQLLHDGPQLSSRQRIDADARLVEQQQVRRSNQRARQAQLLFHAA